MYRKMVRSCYSYHGHWMWGWYSWYYWRSVCRFVCFFHWQLLIYIEVCCTELVALNIQIGLIVLGVTLCYLQLLLDYWLSSSNLRVVFTCPHMNGFNAKHIRTASQTSKAFIAAVRVSVGLAVGSYSLPPLASVCCRGRSGLPQGVVRQEGLGKLKKTHSPPWFSNPRPSFL
jgi:hypothetical protein